MRNSDQYLIPFELCRFEEGYNKIVLFDVERANVYNLPKTAKDLLYLFGENTGKEIYERYRNSPDELATIEEYYDFFLENEICFEVSNSEKKLFPKISEDWDFPSELASIHIRLEENKYLPKVSEDLIDLINRFNVQAIIIEFLDDNLSELQKFVTKIEATSIVQIEIILEKGNILPKETIHELANTTFKLNTVYVYNAQLECVEELNFNSIHYFQKSIETLRINRHKNYYPFLDFKLLNYWESKNYNLYYNRKLIINNGDVIGNLIEKNVIAPLTYFAQKANSLEFLLQIFADSWGLNKDKIDVCNQCEYRRICLDDRIFQKRQNGTFYSESECSYNPFISKWGHESGYATLADCGVIITSQGISIDEELIESINQRLYD